ncbi:hypothetical protein TNCV_4870391 [Trichonephila clavipes]|nr:hypothetical protein TNCV_4870391 [Trichonephila clavipes]
MSLKACRAEGLAYVKFLKVQCPPVGVVWELEGGSRSGVVFEVFFEVLHCDCPPDGKMVSYADFCVVGLGFENWKSKGVCSIMPEYHGNTLNIPQARDSLEGKEKGMSETPDYPPECF